MASPQFNAGDSVYVTGGAFDGRSGIVTTAAVAGRSLHAFAPSGTDASTDVWVALTINGKSQMLMLLPEGQLRHR